MLAGSKSPTNSNRIFTTMIAPDMGPWDFGVIAVLKERCNETISKMIIDSYKSHNGLLMVADDSQDRSQAYLCGYPFSVECESGGDPYAGIDVKPEPQKEQLIIMVAGGMFCMSNHDVVSKKDDKQAPPKSGETKNERKLRSQHELSTIPCLKVMPTKKTRNTQRPRFSR